MTPPSDPQAATPATADATDAAGPADGPELSYEEAREELVEVVRRLESGGSNLEDSLALWERGEKLAQICQSWLDGARRRLEAALQSDAGSRDA